MALPDNQVKLIIRIVALLLFFILLGLIQRYR